MYARRVRGGMLIFKSITGYVYPILRRKIINELFIYLICYLCVTLKTDVRLIERRRGETATNRKETPATPANNATPAMHHAAASVPW